MKVYFVTWISPITPSAPAQRIKNYLRCIIDAGFKCELLLKRQDRQISLGEEISEVNCKNMLGQCPLHPTVRRKLFCFLSELYTLCYLIFKLKQKDIVFFYDRGCFWSKGLISVAHIKGAKILCDLCEFPFGEGAESCNTIKKRKRYERYILSRVDGIIPISDALADYAKQHSKSDCIITKIPILVDYLNFDLDDKSSEAAVPYIFHSGTLYERKDGILGMLDAFGRAVHQIDFPVKFISTGYKEKSPHAVQIDEIINSYNIYDSVEFVGFLTDTEMKDYLQKSSVVIINKSPNQQNTYCFSTKLGEYMAAGKAIIITQVGEAMNWLVDGEDSIIIKPDDVSALADTVVNLFTNIELRTKIGKSAKIHCKKYFDYKNWSIELRNMFEQL